MRSLKYSWGHEPRSVLSPNLPTFTTQHSWMSCPSPRWRWTSSLLLNPSPATSLMHWYRSGKLNIHPPALPCLCAGWAQAESCEHQFVSIFLTSSLAVFLWHFPYKCQKVPIMKKNPSTSDSSHLGLAHFFFPEAFSCLSVWGSSPGSPFPKTNPATYGILSEITQEIFPLGGLCLGIFFIIIYLFCPVLGISYRCFSYFEWKGY